MTEITTRVSSTYHHVDNGGVEFVFDIISCEDDTWINPRITINTSYFGYPTISAVLRDAGFITPEALEEIGAHFIKFAEAVRQAQKEAATKAGP